MKTWKLITYAIILSLTTNSNAQFNNILLKVNDREVSVDEFKWLYLKNNGGEQHTGLEDYIDLYTRLRLKVEAAEEAGIQTRASFKSELAGYRKQLAKNYLTDQNVKERLLDRAYERYKTEIYALHILIKCPADASTQDTLRAYNKALNIRQRIKLGEPFESVAKGASDDPAVNINGGNLGYFTVFQTPLAFENAVYELMPGELSEPVRTADGFHIIKVQDKRQNQGRIKVTHIMKATPPGSTETTRSRAKHEIDSLYQLIQKGADFSLLAKNSSDDIMTAQNGGELPWFGCGEMIHKFSVAAFQLLRDNDISEPVKTVYGWHIIKRIDKEPFPRYEDAKKYLESRLSNSYLMSLSRKSFAEKLKKEYNYELNKNSLEWFYSLADSAFRYSGDYNIPGNIPDDILYSFASEKCRMPEFAVFIKQNGSQAPEYSSAIYINTLLDQKVYNHLIDYENSVLEEKYPEFRYLMNEFYDGILLFEISDSLIWKRSESDYNGIMQYYNTRKDEFIEKAEVLARIYEIVSHAGRSKTRKIQRAIRKYHDSKDYYRLITDVAISGRDTLVKITEGIWQKGTNPILDNIMWNTGLNQQKGNNGIIVVDILGVKKERYKDLEEVHGKLLPGYKEYLEEEWVNELRKKYPVSFNRELMEKLKSEIGQ